MSHPPEPASAYTAPPSQPRGVSLTRTILLVIASFTITFVLGSIYSIARSGIEEARQSSLAQMAHALGMAMYSYSQDHGGKYPQGKSSTDVFQQLIDQKYATDPTLFYFPMEGKSKPEGTKLKPENVSWDVTADVQPDDPDFLPIVFLTGYKIQYQFHHGPDESNWFGLAYGPGTFMPFYTKGNMAEFVRVAADGTARVFVSTQSPFKARAYRQLTPDGPLPVSP